MAVNERGQNKIGALAKDLQVTACAMQQLGTAMEDSYLGVLYRVSVAYEPIAFD